MSLRMIVAGLCLWGLSCYGQIAPLGKVADPVSQRLQKRYFDRLQRLSSEAASIRFPYAFYFSQTLDIDEGAQKQRPQGSIRFDQYNHQAVLAISGNYYVSYSSERFNHNQRARKTYQDVVLPLLKTAVASMDGAVPFEAYAFEISHHVRSQVLKVGTEGPENLMMVFPRVIAERLVRAKEKESEQSALLESDVYLNGLPLTLWLTGDDAPDDVKTQYLARRDAVVSATQSLLGEQSESGTLISSRLVPEPNLVAAIRERKKAAHEISPEQLESLQTSYKAVLQRLLPDLKEQAHLVDYAAPAFIAFHGDAYLQISLNTDLQQPAGASPYRIAAMAFDSHVSHVLRAVTKYFHDTPQFEGVDFATTVHQSGEPASLSVEFIAPFSALSCYEKYDCTGQELISRSFVLINGERVELNLERAEANYSPVNK